MISTINKKKKSKCCAHFSSPYTKTGKKATVDWKKWNPASGNIKWFSNCEK
jgi:hypothetical protein